MTDEALRTDVTVKLLNATGKTIMSWQVDKQNLVQRSGCFGDALDENIVTNPAQEIELRDENAAAVGTMMVFLATGQYELGYMKDGRHEGAKAEAKANMYKNDMDKSKDLHEHAVAVYVLADKYDIKRLASSAISDMSFSLSCMFPEFTQLKDEDANTCWSIHIQPILNAFGGEYPMALWGAFCTAVGALSRSHEQYGSDWDIVKDFVKQEKHLAFYCMNVGVKIPELEDEYDEDRSRYNDKCIDKLVQSLGLSEDSQDDDAEF